MEKKKHTIIVPHDFTEVGEYALEHALVIAKIMENDITLVHIVKEEDEVERATEKCKEVAERTFKKHYHEPKVIVRVGSIFTAIGEVALEVNANLVIMGTHGVKGMQKLTGSWALKVIVSSPVPVVIVQAPPEHKKFEKIVFPVNFKQENKEKHHWVNYLSKYYKAKFYIIKQEVKDKTFRQRVQSNLTFAKKYFQNKEIDFEIYTAPGKNKFSTETVNYAVEIGADLILIMTTRDITLADYALGANEQQIIANKAKLPVMCVNPRSDLRKSYGFAAMSG